MKIESRVSLKPYNTFGVDQYASTFAIITSKENVLDLIQKDPHPVILGGGSNVLLTKDIDVLVIKNEIKGFRILVATDDYIWVRIQGGENWHESVASVVHAGWAGIENLSLIPGTVGAAPIQNIGAYGVEIKDVLAEVEVIELSTGKVFSISNESCEFGYRDSIFKQAAYKNKYFVLSIVLKLSKNGKPNTSYGEIEKNLREKGITDPTIKDLHETVIDIRTNKLPDPKIIGNAGSFFKNPVVDQNTFETIKSKYPNGPSYKLGDHAYKIPAGWLIDQCGWKGKRIGKVGCYEKQALVIVNHGGATGAEIWSFAQLLQKDVMDKFGIEIEAEINVW